MVKRDAIIQFCNEYLNIDAFSDYGPKGLQFLGKAEVNKIVTGVSVSRELFAAAAEAQADMILVHHGEFWNNMSQRVDRVRKQRLIILFEHDMTLLGYHLPLDAHREIGNNVLLVQAVGMQVGKEQFGLYEGMEIGALGVHTGLPLGELVSSLEKILATEALVFPFGPDTLKTVGFVSGGGAGDLAEAIDRGLDAFVTGESKESTYHLAKEAGINLIYAHHYNSEKLGIQALGHKLAGQFGIEHQFIDIPCPL